MPFLYMDANAHPSCVEGELLLGEALAPPPPEPEDPDSQPVNIKANMKAADIASHM
jgi:hypothetical protein